MATRLTPERLNNKGIEAVKAKGPSLNGSFVDQILARSPIEPTDAGTRRMIVNQNGKSKVYRIG